MGKCKLEKREPAYILPPETYAEFKRRGKGIVTCRKERESEIKQTTKYIFNNVNIVRI